MLIMNQRQIRDEKIAQLQEGKIAYAESYELIRIMKRAIERKNLNVHYDETKSGCWFTPLSEKIRN